MRKALGILIACLALTACSPSPKEEKTPSAVSAYAKMGHLATDNLAQMSFSFQGNPPEQEIREKLDKALGLYGMEANDSNRDMAGRTLVSMRKETGNSEMAILGKMLSVPPSGTKFEDAAARIAEDMNR